MKTALVRLVYLVWLFATASADFTLGSFPDVVSERQEYTLNWTAQGNYVCTGRYPLCIRANMNRRLTRFGLY